MLRRFETSGWNHRMVIDDFIKFYGDASIGDGWDKPTAREVLEIAAQTGSG